MSTLWWLVIITFVAGVGGTGMGGVVSSAFKRDSSKIVSLLLSFAAGVMLSVVCFDLIDKSIFPTEPTKYNSLLLTSAVIIVGYFVIYLLNWLIDKNTNDEIKHIDKEHPKTADSLGELIHANHYEEHKKSHSSLFVAGTVMACAIALHNVPEGMVIGASYAGANASLFEGSGFALAIVIGLHNIPEGMAIAVPLIAGGEKKLKAILITALSGAPTICGALFGYWLGALSATGLTISLSFASGAMLYVVFGELLPESILLWRSKAPAFSVLVGMLVGMMIIFA